jgi:hypothetical protein
MINEANTIDLDDLDDIQDPINDPQEPQDPEPDPVQTPAPDDEFDLTKELLTL